MHYRRLRIDGGTYFFTVVTHLRQRLFRDAWAVELLHAAIARERARRPFEIVAFVILPEHLHAIWTLPEGDSDFSTRWMEIKRRFSLDYSRRVALGDHPIPKRRGLPVWQDRFWEHWIRSERDLIAHMDYMHFNPVKHGLVAAPKDWLHSSFRAFVAEGVYEMDWSRSLDPEVERSIAARAE